MSSLSSGMAIAPAIAPQIGAFIGNHWGWHGCFIATFLIGAIILYALVFFLQETNSYIINRTHTSQKLENHLMKLPTSFLRVFFNKQFLGYTLLISFSFSAYFVFIGLSSFLFQNIFNYSSTQYSYIILLVTTGYLIGTSLTKTLNKKKYSIEQIIVIGTIICMVSSFSLLFTFILQSSWLIIFSMMWMRLGIGLIMPSSQVGAMKCTNHSAGWNMGCLFFVEFIISAIMIALGSYIDSFHIGYGLIASILLSMIFVFTGYRLIKN
jgi:DHA1 family bicyclomycin/chloramphenicol resistance-like MFS transporter